MAKRNWVIITQYYNTHGCGDTTNEESFWERKPTKEQAEGLLEMDFPSLVGNVWLARPSKVLDDEGRNALHPEFSWWDGDTSGMELVASEETKEFRVLIDGCDGAEDWSDHLPYAPDAEEIANMFDLKFHDETTEFEVQERWTPFGREEWDTVGTWKVCPACQTAHLAGDAACNTICFDIDGRCVYECDRDDTFPSLMDYAIAWSRVSRVTATSNGKPYDMSWFVDYHDEEGQFTMLEDHIMARREEDEEEA